MKLKWFMAAMLIISIALFTLTACAPTTDDPTDTDIPSDSDSTTPPPSETPSDSEPDTKPGNGSNLSDLMTAIEENGIAKHEVLKDGYYARSEITNDNLEYHFGTSDIVFEEGIVLEPEMGGAFSVCLISVPEGNDIEAIKTKIKENVDPMKWVCMGVDPQNIFVESSGNVIILVMSDDGGQELIDTFLASASA